MGGSTSGGSGRRRNTAWLTTDGMTVLFYTGKSGCTEFSLFLQILRALRDFVPYTYAVLIRQGKTRLVQVYFKRIQTGG